MAEPTKKLAVLIDADNTQPSIATALLAEIAKYGTANVKRIYGDWTTDNLKGWKKVLLDLAIQPIQQFGYTTGKNATDSRMIIDAMDLLYSERFDGFCLVSSDSDFTGLASRLREAGLTVYGFGERKTPVSLRAACDKFIYLDVLRGAAPKARPEKGNEAATLPPAKARAAKKPQRPTAQPAEAERPADVRHDAKSDPKTDVELHELLAEAIDDAADDDGWATLGAVGNLIAKRRADFDSRNYGYRKLSELVAAAGLFEIDERKSADGRQKTVYLRDPKAAA
ncbi:NYN domain-containing protein [Solimonas terrae]|uniref:NYN domain-containing protein n=1 Tax=Solimonas terrae TaxID=1396819 RepID=A0A6M2BTZ0_9GAMM|nr:NYN domain-containing protein [Solimonas terrae]NGY05810.1 NYN domain-containing protein [Solimonas terrae]